MIVENKDKDNDSDYKRLIPYIEGMVPVYIDAELAREDVADKGIVYQLLCSIPEKISV
ncbi:hypothetical protein [Anaerosporobacter sp.]|uniref:hypothetical protein n=1 Tax=Anaerosporobacter sp. TaxID=1872529 RepID=UPI00286F950E|nr:hypothetical protein [Anaerosporobacter sp.]